MRWAWVLGFAGALLFGAKYADAAPRPRLSVTRGAGAEGCPDAEALAALVAARTKNDALEPGGPGEASAFQVLIDRTPRGFEATVQANGGMRAIEDAGPTCRALGDAVAIMLTLLLDDTLAPPPSAVAPAITPGPRTPPLASRPVAVAPPVDLEKRPPAPSSTPPVESYPGLSLDMRLLVTDGIQLPGAFGFEVDGRLQITSRFRLELGSLSIPSAHKDLPIGKASVELVAGNVDGCFRFAGALRQVHGDACGDVAVGALSGAGQGFPSNQTSLHLWGSTGLSADIEGPLVGPIGWSLRGGFLVPFQRVSFTVSDEASGTTTTAFQASPIGAHVGLGITATFF